MVIACVSSSFFVFGRVWKEEGNSLEKIPINEQSAIAGHQIGADVPPRLEALGVARRSSRHT